jgi:hypothetical protein
MGHSSTRPSNTYVLCNVQGYRTTYDTISINSAAGEQTDKDNSSDYEGDLDRPLLIKQVSNHEHTQHHDELTQHHHVSTIADKLLLGTLCSFDCVHFVFCMDGVECCRAG